MKNLLLFVSAVWALGGVGALRDDLSSKTGNKLNSYLNEATNLPRVRKDKENLEAVNSSEDRKQTVGQSNPTHKGRAIMNDFMDQMQDTTNKLQNKKPSISNETKNSNSSSTKMINSLTAIFSKLFDYVYHSFKNILRQIIRIFQESILPSTMKNIVEGRIFF